MNLKEYEEQFYAQPNFDFEEGRSNDRINRVLASIGTNKSVLDVGCWGGDIAKIIQDKGNKVTAIDISKESIKRTKEKGIKAFICDITQATEILDKSFDVVYMGGMIEHLFDIKEAFREVYRILKDDGKVIITTLNICSLRDRVLVLFGHLPAYYGIHEDHIRVFNKKKLTKLLEDAGFKNILFEGSEIEMPYSRGKLLVWKTRKFPTLSSQFMIEAFKKK